VFSHYFPGKKNVHIGQRLPYFVLESDKAHFASLLEESYDFETSHLHGEFRIYRDNAHVASVELHLFRFESQKSKGAVMLLLKDITQEKARLQSVKNDADRLRKDEEASQQRLRQQQKELQQAEERILLLQEWLLQARPTAHSARMMVTVLSALYDEVAALADQITPLPNQLHDIRDLLHKYAEINEEVDLSEKLLEIQQLKDEIMFEDIWEHLQHVQQALSRQLTDLQMHTQQLLRSNARQADEYTSFTLEELAQHVQQLFGAQSDERVYFNPFPVFNPQTRVSGSYFHTHYALVTLIHYMHHHYALDELLFSEESDQEDPMLRLTIKVYDEEVVLDSDGMPAARNDAEHPADLSLFTQNMAQSGAQHVTFQAEAHTLHLCISFSRQESLLATSSEVEQQGD
jgi:hypothetical protein